MWWWDVPMIVRSCKFVGYVLYYKIQLGSQTSVVTINGVTEV